MMNKLKTYFKSKVKLDDKCSKLEHQIKLMQEHMEQQRGKISMLERKLHIAREMWDISNKTKTY